MGLYTLMLKIRHKLTASRLRLKRKGNKGVFYLLVRLLLKLLHQIITMLEFFTALRTTNKSHRKKGMLILVPSNKQCRKTIFVNISNLVCADLKTGIHRVVRSLLDELLTSPPDGYKVSPVYFDGQSQHFLRAESWLRQNYESTRILTDEQEIAFGNEDIFLEIDLDYTLSHNVEFERILVDAKNKGCKICFVVYDLLPVQMPQYFPQGLFKIHKKWLEKIAQFNTLICISQTVALELNSWFNIEKIAVNAAIKHFQLGKDIENSKPTYGLPPNANEIIDCLKSRQTFLMVGTIEGRKGHEQVLEAFNILWENNYDFNLCFVGKEGWLVDRLLDKLRTHKYLYRRVFWLERASDEFLVKIYEASSALIIASYGEGYGLPVIEAASYNIPIIARDIPIFREVAQQHAFYFKAPDALGLSEEILKWSNMLENGAELSSCNLKTINWSESTRQLLHTIDHFEQ